MVHRVSVPIHSREAAILDAMPAMVALLDSEGGILSVNEAWRRFADENALPHPTHCIGLNYLEVCDHAQGDDSSEAQRVAKGIRSVIGKRLKQYSIEYPCHSPMVQRWFLMTATPLAEGSSENIVVMHLNITERKLAEQAVRESRQRLDGIINSAMDAIVTVDEHQRVVLANPAAERIFGYTLIEMMGESVEQIIPERFCLEHSQSRVAFLKKGHGSHSIGTLQVINGRRKSGDMFPIEATLSSATIGGQRLYTAIVRDVTELTRSEQQIRRLNRVHQVLTAINNLIVHVHDRAELFKGACKIAIEAGGFRMALIGIADPLTKQVTIAASAGIEPQSLNDLQGLMSSRERASSMMIVRALEQKKPLFSNDAQHDTGVSFTSVHEAMGIRSMAAFPLIVAEEAVGVIALFASEVDRFQGEEMQLLTELSGDVAFAIGYLEKQDKLDYLAYYDVLTGLANRRLFLERVSQFMRADDGSRHMLALGVIDLVRFKSINDSSGRPAGDMILRQVAEWLTVHLSSSSMLARVEGDRFAVVIPDVIRIGEVGQLMEKTLNALANHPFRINTGVFRITGYAGVAMFPQDGLDAETLIYSAEAALNRAKASGKACLFYTREITERAVGKLSLENQLRRALENEEFVLHYQAKKNVATGKLVGAEALLRWVDPQSGLVPPGRFVPMLEETGLIHEVGSWVLRTAVKDYLRWHAAGLDEFRIAVNVSTQQLRNHAFIEEIREVIRANPAAAAGLEMEITESLIMEDIPHSIASLQSLRDLGIHIAIDDFGTGFSSLSYLYKLPIDTLKIDRSFVSNMTASPEGLSLVSTIISLAHSLKLDVVAEGVETEEQSRLLRLLNCDVIQGHLYAVPIPAKLLEENYLKLTFNKIIER